MFIPGEEELEDGEIRVTVLGSGNPWLYPTIYGQDRARDKEDLGCILLIARSQPFGKRIG
jgi:hypothetical protein